MPVNRDALVAFVLSEVDRAERVASAGASVFAPGPGREEAEARWLGESLEVIGRAIASRPDLFVPGSPHYFPTVGRKSDPVTLNSATPGDCDGSDPTKRGRWIWEPVAVMHHLESGALLITPPPGCTGHIEGWRRQPDNIRAHRAGCEGRLMHDAETCPVHEAGSLGSEAAA